MTKEVGYTSEDNNDRRLPGSVQPEAGRGDSSYGTNEYAKVPPLDLKDTGGVVGQPSVGGDYSFSGIKKSASTSGPSDRFNYEYNHENLSKKFKYPQVSQDAPAKGRGQFEDHT